MAQLTDWLSSLDHVSAAVPVTATIRGKRWIGARYRGSDFDGERLYLLGDLPDCYKHSSRTAFLINREDWYVACYMQDDLIPERYAAYHPHGRHFMLCRWSVPDGSTIDQHERRSYGRVPVELT